MVVDSIIAPFCIDALPPGIRNPKIHNVKIIARTTLLFPVPNIDPDS